MLTLWRYCCKHDRQQIWQKAILHEPVHIMKKKTKIEFKICKRWEIHRERNGNVCGVFLTTRFSQCDLGSHLWGPAWGFPPGLLLTNCFQWVAHRPCRLVFCDCREGQKSSLVWPDLNAMQFVYPWFVFFSLTQFPYFFLFCGMVWLYKLPHGF